MSKGTSLKDAVAAWEKKNETKASESDQIVLSGIMLLFIPAAVPIGLVLVAVAFPQSACSFWPFAHMTAIETLEKDMPQRTFNLDLALNILA